MKRKRTVNGAARSSSPQDPQAPSNDMTVDEEDQNDSPIDEDEEVMTPLKRRGRPPNSAKEAQTPTKSHRSALHRTPRRNRTSENRQGTYSTPSKKVQFDDGAQTPSKTLADRSARRKSARRLHGHTAAEDESDEDELAGESSLAQRIRDEEEDDEDVYAGADDGIGSDDGMGGDVTAETPSKRGRGRPKGSKKKRDMTPPPDMTPNEQYFFQNRPGGLKTSDNTLSSLSLLKHEDYFNKMKTHEEHHNDEIQFLFSLHRSSFPQWAFELEENFNVCTYGWGSKYKLLMDFATYISNEDPQRKIVVVNGYHTTLTIRDILNSIASVVSSLINVKLGAQPADMTTTITNALAHSPPKSPTLLLIHSLDSASLRRPATQALLARLASSPHINIVASADTPNFPILWDASLRAQFSWVFHDVTTFSSFDIEIGAKEGGVVDEVNALLGRSGRRMDGREGVMYVLRSLTENARSLFALLIAELLSMEDEDDVDGFDDTTNTHAAGGDFEDALSAGKPKVRMNTAKLGAGIQVRTLYQKASSQFIATNEHAFRAMLKEFFDHEMLAITKDGVGAEMLRVPFRREELELILGELVGAE